jgi:3-hydroxybutyryl-CoA dehydrogenase
MADILLIGNKTRRTAFKSRTGWEVDESDIPLSRNFDAYQLVVDLDFDQYPERIAFYSNSKSALFLLHSVRIQLTAVLSGVNAFDKANRFAGLNALAGCLESEHWESSSAVADNLVHSYLEKKGIGLRKVNDRVGMVSPRVIAMIINEAFYTVQEGTANRADIDLGMQLGTNYPQGPFAWCDRWGISEVYHLLDALWQDTREPRYLICPLLKTTYLESTSAS